MMFTLSYTHSLLFQIKIFIIVYLKLIEYDFSVSSVRHGYVCRSDIQTENGNIIGTHVHRYVTCASRIRGWNVTKACIRTQSSLSSLQPVIYNPTLINKLLLLGVV